MRTQSEVDTKCWESEHQYSAIACWNHETWVQRSAWKEQMPRSYPLLQSKEVCHKVWKYATAGGIKSGIMCRRGTKPLY